ncbi:MAG: ACT domain-containing protein [Thermoprotei archaeon]|nr:MAG: ACT domain-containing protein [Thermoprotei archaeon]
MREYVSSRPYLLEALSKKIVNYSALARLIVSELNLGKENIPAVKMALRRFAEKLEEKSFTEDRVREIIASSSLQLINDIVVCTICGVQGSSVLTKEVFLKKTGFLQVTQSSRHMTIMMDKDLYNSIRSLIEKTLAKIGDVEVLENQTAILITSPREIIKTPGVIAYILSALASQGINITQFISCHTDTILIVDRREALKAYTVLEKLILNARRFVQNI